MTIPLARRRIVSGLAALALAAAAGCSGDHKSHSKSSAPEKTYPMTGEVIRLEPKGQIAVIKHENIDGWMEAMTMEFPVRDQAEFAKLAPGKRIRATVHVQELDYWISEIQPE
jgi:protein SCO1/2